MPSVIHGSLPAIRRAHSSASWGSDSGRTSRSVSAPASLPMEDEVDRKATSESDRRPLRGRAKLFRLDREPVNALAGGGRNRIDEGAGSQRRAGLTDASGILGTRHDV